MLTDLSRLSDCSSDLDEETPGFACLTEALRATRTGEADRATVAWYQDALVPRLAQTRERLGTLVIPASVAACVNPMLRNAELLCDKLQNVLELVDDYLHEGCGEALDEAISSLDILQDKFGQVF